MEKYNIIIDNNHFDMDLIWQILQLRKEIPQAFFDKLQKISVYFMFPYSILSKTNSNRDYIPIENIESDMNRYQDNNCSMFFELENVDVSEDCFHDRYSNLVLSMAKDKEAYAVVFNNELAKYIKAAYPSIKLVQSEVKRNLFIEQPYDMNIVDYITYKNNKDRIQYKQSYILAVNSYCKNSYRCVNMLSSNKLNYGINRPIQCSERNNSFDAMTKNELFVSIEEMEKINNEGIENFLVKTNCDDRFQMLEAYMYYLFKPEYRDAVRLNLIKSCFARR